MGRSEIVSVQGGRSQVAGMLVGDVAADGLILSQSWEKQWPMVDGRWEMKAQTLE
jgi:hypothetical protein